MTTERHLGIAGALLGSVLLVTPALARGPRPPYREATFVVRVGQTGSQSVGFAQGLVCDDLTTVWPELRGESPTSNRLYVTGLKRGSTLCRVGTLGVTPVVMFRIVVSD